MKEFVVEIKEINGEQEYTFYKIIKAITENSAWKKGDQIGRRWYEWYDGKPKKENDMWMHLGGQIAVAVNRVYEFNQEDFIKRFRS